MPKTRSKRARGNGDGSLAQDPKTGVWIAWYFDADGRRRKRSTGRTNRREAEEILARWVKEVRDVRAGLVDPAAIRRRDELRRPLRDHVRGRIYRVVWDAPAPAPRRTLRGADDAALTDALADPNPFWRLTAQRLLVEGRRTGAVPALRRLAAEPPALPALHALWTLHGLGALDTATHRGALAHAEAAVRRNAIRALGRD